MSVATKETATQLVTQLIEECIHHNHDKQDQGRIKELALEAQNGLEREALTTSTEKMQIQLARRTPQEILDLKAGWRRDPCFDIEDTEGFEAHRTELLIHRLEMENKWVSEQRDEYHKGLTGIAKTLTPFLTHTLPFEKKMEQK